MAKSNMRTKTKTSTSGGKGGEGERPAARARDPHAGKPFVACVTPTYGRHKFLPWLISMFNQQSYPQSRMVLIILDDGPRIPEGDTALLRALEQPNIRYVRHDAAKLPIGGKRNMLNKLAIEAGADIMVALDDDDFVPRERVEHSVTALLRSGKQICGSSILYIYFADDGELKKFGPYSANHATNGTMAYTRQYAETHAYDEVVPYGEESSFTGGFSEPLEQLDPFKTLLCIAHKRNSFDKSGIRNAGAATVAKLKDFVKDRVLREFYAGLVKGQLAERVELPSTQRHGAIELELQQ